VARVRDIARLTAQSAWRGFVGFYNSDNLTYAASIAYYALLSCNTFPGSSTSSRRSSMRFARAH
jgi:uncharacterized BrkB/YihY/UPF0761 family membrane protein